MALEWLYLGDQRLPQGPFSLSDMRGWYADGFFEKNLQVKHITAAAYVDMQHCNQITDLAASAPAAATAAEAPGAGGNKHRGRVKNWQDEKGFGFIVPGTRARNPHHNMISGDSPERLLAGFLDDASLLPASETGDLFVHRTELIGASDRVMLVRDIEVLFELAMGKDGRSCAKVRFLLCVDCLSTDF